MMKLQTIHILSLLLIMLMPVHAQAQLSTSAMASEQVTVPDDEARREAANKALKNLSRKLLSSGLKHPGRNGGYQVTYAMAGMAFLADGGDTNKGPWKRELSKVLQYLIRQTGQNPKGRMGKGQDLSTWVYASSLMFIAELHHRHPTASTKRYLTLWTEELLKRQTDNGGWLHSGNTKSNTAPYQDFSAITIWCLTALAMAKNSGAEVPEDSIKSATQYLLDCTRADGEVAYSTKHKKIVSRFRRVVPGRTAGAWTALQLAGITKHPKLPLMQSFSMKYGRALPYGHGSPVMHLHWGATLAWTSSPKEWEAYWKYFGHGFIQRQHKNGMIQMPIKHSFEGEDRASAMQAWILLLPEQKLKLYGKRP